MTNTDEKPNRKRRNLRYGLRSFLIIIVVIAVFLGWYVSRVEKQKAAVRWVKDNGGVLKYDYEEDSSTVNLSVWPIRSAAAGILGNDYFSDVSHVDFLMRNIQDLSPIQTLRRLEHLGLDYCSVVDLTPLESLPCLKSLSLYNNPVSDISALSTLTKLEALKLGETEVRDIRSLASLTNLKELSIPHTAFDLSTLKKLPNLETLCIVGELLSKHELMRIHDELPQIRSVLSTQDFSSEVSPASNPDN